MFQCPTDKIFYMWHQCLTGFRKLVFNSGRDFGIDCSRNKPVGFQCPERDSLRATGLEDGEYTLGGQPVTVRGNLATLHDGTIAGSATNLMDCMRFVVKTVGLPLETAVMCATENPAKEIGIFNEVGSISVGKRADFVLLDQELNIAAVYIDGKEFTC